MGMITNDTLEKIRDQIQARNRHLRDFADLYAAGSWDKIQIDVKGLSRAALKTKYPIGTELVCHYTLGSDVYDCPWVVLDNDRDVEWEDGSIHQGLWLGMKYATVEDIQFDAAEDTTVDSGEEPNALENWYYWGLTGSTYTKLTVAVGDALPFASYDSIHKCGVNNLDVLRYGYNRYRDSGVRQWLNSDKAATEWWESTHLGDKAPSQLSTRAGFMAGLDADFLAVLHPVKIQVAANTVTDAGVTDVMYDTFFLQSLEEVYGVPQKAGVEGLYFPYWKTVTGLNNPSNGSSSETNDARKIPRISAPTGSAATVRLRSAYRGTACYAWYVIATGYLYGVSYGYGASNSYASAPACVIS